MIKVELQETMGSDAAIAAAAWTSSLDYEKKKARTEEDIKRVVNMLADLKHSVPFESVIFRFWIKMPIQTDRQHMTHRIASHSGMSGRYRTMPNETMAVPPDVRAILKKTNALYLEQEYTNLCSEANFFYISLLEHTKIFEKNKTITNQEYKRVREFFRGVLPQNNMVERITIMNLRSFANYQKLRNSDHAQPEIRQVAELMLDAVRASNVCPIAIDALERNNWNI